MEVKSRTKWLVTIVLAGILLGLAMAGGQWGISYAESSFPKPVINQIRPFEVRVGSPNKIVIISGSHFVEAGEPRVTLQDPDTWDWVTLVPPLQVLPDGISQVVSADYFVQPMRFKVGVYHFADDPTIPSEQVILNVYVPQYSYLTLVKK